MSVQSKADAKELLAQAVRLLQPRQASTRLRATWRGVEYDVRFDWPGVVNVLPVNDKRPVVSSAPGKPGTVETWRDEL
jgi:hypothetical protein